jgi:hypothetical protein
MPEIWLDPGVPALHADVCQVQSTREEFALLFGNQTAGDPKLQRRVVLPPSLAKQLALALAGALPDPNASPAGTTRSAATEADVPAAARPMLALVQALGAGFGLEKSFKLSARSLLDERVILGVRTANVPHPALLQVCRQLGMPGEHLAQFEARLPEANTVGFGYEAGTTKVYLEFWERLRARVQRDPRNVEPELLFLGY